MEVLSMACSPGNLRARRRHASTGTLKAAMDSLLSVEVAYADACRQIVVPVEVPGGTTLAQAVALSAIAEQLVGVDVVAAPKGVYGKKRPDHWLLEEGDRVEIYRPLVHNPRDARRRRASRQR